MQVTIPEKNLLGAKIGDKVVIEHRFASPRIATITGVTGGGNYKIGGSIFYPNGKMRGDYDFYHTHAHIASNEEIKRIGESIFTDKVMQKMRLIKTLKYSQAVKIAEILGLSIDE
jgi:hypothetical protein